MKAGGSLRRQSSLVADSLKGAPSLLVDPSSGPLRGGQRWGISVIESGEFPVILGIEALLRSNRPQGSVGVGVRSDLNKVLVELGDVDAKLIDTVCSNVPRDSVVFVKRIFRMDDPQPKR